MSSPTVPAPALRPSRTRRRPVAQFFLAEQPEPSTSPTSSPLEPPLALPPNSYSHLDGLRTSILDLPTRNESRAGGMDTPARRRSSSYFQFFSRRHSHAQSHVRAHPPALGLASPITGLSLVGAAGTEAEVEMYDKHVEMLQLLMEIHRVLYRGEMDEDIVDDMGVDADAMERGEDIKVLADRFFEGDCIYDHPLLQISNRRHMVAHFIMLNLAASPRIPLLSPAALVRHVAALRTYARQMMARAEMMDEEKGFESKPISEKEGRGKISVEPSAMKERMRVGYKEKWWKLWDVTSEVRDLGAMETFDGHHSGKIDHVITLSILPALLSPCPQPHLRPRSNSASSAGSIEMDVDQRSYAQKLAAAVAEEFEPFLRWRLPMSTLVEFNEVGKAVRVRDQVDVRDLIEALVPFAKTLNGLSRRVTGFVCGALGTYAMRCLPGGRQLENLREPVELRQGGRGLNEKAFRIDTAVEVDPPFLGPADIPLSHSAPAFSSGLPSPPDANADADAGIATAGGGGGVPLFPSASYHPPSTSLAVSITTSPNPNETISPTHNSLGLVTSAPDCLP